MKCRFVRDVMVEPKGMAGEMVRHIVMRQVSGKDVAYWPVGTEYEHPKAAFFVRQGMAEPADAECEAAVTGLDLAKVQHAYDRQAKGIHPKDWKLYDAGFIAGYDEEGEYLPGPNYAEYERLLDEERKAEEEDDL